MHGVALPVSVVSRGGVCPSPSPWEAEHPVFSPEGLVKTVFLVQHLHRGFPAGPWLVTKWCSSSLLAIFQVDNSKDYWFKNQWSS